MNVEQAILTGGVTGTVILVAGIIYKFLHHSSCVSSCCGRVVKFRSDLTPPREGFTASAPTRPEVDVNNK